MLTESNIDGLAAQLYMHENSGIGVWWHLMNKELKAKYRKMARKQISKYMKETP